MKEMLRQGLGIGLERRTLGIYWEEGRLSFVLLDRHGAIEKSGILVLTDDDEGQRARQIESFAAGIAPPLCVTLVIPQKNIFGKILRLPSRATGEIGRMIKRRAQRMGPLGASDFSATHVVLEKSKEGCSFVLSAVVRRQSVAAPLKLLSQMGLSPDRVIPEYMAFCHFLPKDETLRATLELSLESMAIALYRGDRPIAARWVPLPFADALRETIAGECERSVAAWREQGLVDGKGEFIILDFTPETSGLVGSVKEKLPWPVVSFDPLAATAHRNRIPCQLIEGAVLKAWGGARFPYSGVNLLPAEANAPTARKRRNWERVLAGVLLALLTGTGGGLMAQRIHFQELYLKSIEGRLEAIAPEASKVSDMLAQMNRRNARIGDKNTLLRVLSEMEGILPKPASFQTMTFDKRRGLEIQGIGPSLSVPLDIVGSMRKVDRFKNTTMRSSSASQRNGQEIVRFEIFCEFPTMKDGP